MSIEDQITSVLNEYAQIKNTIAGVFFDAIEGFKLNVKELNRRQLEYVQQSGSNEPKDILLQYLDSAWIMYGEGEPNNPKSVIHHQSTQKDFKDRNSDDGSNHIFVGNMALIVLYQFWEENYRGKIADILGVDKNRVECNIFGDLRIIRNSILHHNGIALPEVSHCKILKWFHTGDTILIKKQMFFELLNNSRCLEIKIIKASPEIKSCSEKKQ